MNQSVEDKIVASLLDILADGFNRALAALEDAGAIDATSLRSDYKFGGKYYDLVTDSLEKTANYARPRIKEIIENGS
ncbi:hypothetical protein [Hyphococcus sp.]|jgi:hypothetical protein|uniref:hypothetical protein n=1 Tax=Hyphococcus sp. TaxID=2038636 RepID=UPI003D1077F4